MRGQPFGLLTLKLISATLLQRAIRRSGGGSKTGTKKMPRAVTRKIGHKEKQFIHYCEKFYFLNNAGFPTAEQAAVALNYSVSEINVMLQNVHVKKALERRGLPYQVSGYVAERVTPTQVACALTVMNFADERPIENKLDELGVTPTQYYAWLDDPKYREFVNQRADANLRNIRPEAVTKFTQLVRAGDFRAIQYYFEVTGEFKSQSSQSVQATLQLIIESVQRHVKDPHVLAAISADLLGAAPVATQGVTIDSSLVGDSELVNEKVLTDGSGRSG